MGWASLLAVLRARGLVLVAVLGVTTATALLVSLQLPKKYLAVASVLVDHRPDPISSLIYPGLASPSVMSTQVDVINSERVALRVARNLALADDPAVQQQWRDATGGRGAIESWLAASLRAPMTVRPSRESNVISVDYLAPDPEQAARLANAFVQAYIDTSLELRVDPARQYNSFFDARAKAARDALEAAQSRLSAFERSNGIVANEQRIDVEMTRLSELSSQLVVLQALSAESSSRQAQAAGASADQLQEVLANPVIGQLKSEMSRSQARLQELGTRYGDKHPQVIELRAQIAELGQRIESETRRVRGGTVVSNTINRKREAEVRAALDAQRATVQRINALRDDASVLIRDVESAQRAFEGVTTRLNQSSLESQSTQGNVNLLTRATAPLAPTSPRIGLNVALAALAGLALGLGLMALLELGDRRVRHHGVATMLKLPLLGVMPGPDARRRPGRLPAMAQRVLGVGTPPRRGAAR